MKLIQLFLIPALSFFGGAAVCAYAEPLPAGMTTVALATITNDRNDSVSTIYAMLDEQAVFRGIVLKTATSPATGSAQTKTRVYRLSAIESEGGVVLGQGQGINAIFLRGDIESKNGRGTLVIRFLSNGLFWSYEQCRIGLRRISPYDWKLVNDNQPIDHIEIQTWALGISTLTNVCPTT